MSYLDSNDDLLSEADILKFEKRLNIQIPNDLNEFYLENNGGIPKDDKTYVANEDFEYEVKYFCPLFKENNLKLQSVESLYNLFVVEKRILGEDLLPIAIDHGGFPFCYNLTNNKIYFAEFYDETNYVELYDSLNDFLNNLKSEEELE